MSDGSTETQRAPMTAMASGRSMSAPLSKPQASGIMPGGIARCDLVLQKTKRYTFQMISLRPIVRELTYENVTLDDKWPCSADIAVSV